MIIVVVLLAITALARQPVDKLPSHKDTVDQSAGQPAKNESWIPSICLDPGHGTKNSRRGASGEAKITLAIALEISRQLKNYQYIQAVLTHRKIGQDLGAKNPEEDNRLRARIANQSGAFLFIRLHTDAPSGPAAIYYPQAHPDREIAQASQIAAEYVWTQIKTVLPTSIRRSGVIPESKTAIGANQGGLLTGSRYSKIPVITIEMVPMNKNGKNWISQKKNQEILAQAIIMGIYHYHQYMNVHQKNPPKVGGFYLINLSR